MYAKVFASLWDGSLRGQTDAQIVFIYMLTHADADGNVEIIRDKIASDTGLDEDFEGQLPGRIDDAINILESPDNGSRSAVQDGRRIIRLDEHRNWGWHIVNYQHYRDIRDEESRRAYRAAWARENRRERNVNKHEQNVNKHERACTKVKEEVEVEVSSPPPPPQQNRREGTPSTHRLALIGGMEYIPTLEEISRWSSLYQAVDVDSSLRLMAGWLDANPTKRKTDRGIRRFVAAWLGRDQDRGPRNGTVHETDDYDAKQAQWLAKMQRMTAEKEAELANQRKTR